MKRPGHLSWFSALLWVGVMVGCKSTADPGTQTEPSKTASPGSDEVAVADSSGSAPDCGPAGACRSFRIRYVVYLTDIPFGKTVRLWIPIPSNDSHQVIRDLKVDGPWKVKMTTEPRFGNRMLYLEGMAETASAKVTVSYFVERMKYETDFATLEPEGRDDPKAFALHLEAPRLVVVDERIRKIAAGLTKGKQSTREKARAFYDHIRDEMTYDKSGEGWGRGDSTYACDVGRGNCTDFHAYFMALCLAAEIPSRFQIGLYGAYEGRPGQEYETGGYHCWAEFRIPGQAWVPVDISEADKDPTKTDYFFGGHSNNRVTLSVGRDLVLEPKQAGEPLNYFVNPYAEVGGEPFSGVTKTAYWTDQS